jgi:tRNA G46 methylase TrmB
MKQINDLLEQGGRAHASTDTAGYQTSFSATSLPKAPTELLE